MGGLAPTKYVALYDVHYGYERKNRHKVPLHDARALQLALKFIDDFKPDVIILGGDILDCGAISHHNTKKPGRTDGLRLLADARECRTHLLKPLEDSGAKKLIYITGNHEDWLNDVVDEMPGLDGLLDLKPLLELTDPRWQVIGQGGHVNLGKLTFIHGDQLSGGDHVAKAAVTAYERNIRFGHHHTYQVYTKTSALDIKEGRTGIAIPCLCSKDPKYGEGKANRWVQGFNYGYVFQDGAFADYTPLIINGRMVANGTVYAVPR
jgi:predicted phosphodiesterase